MCTTYQLTVPVERARFRRGARVLFDVDQLGVAKIGGRDEHLSGGDEHFLGRDECLFDGVVDDEFALDRLVAGPFVDRYG